ncbi:DNA polymerase/3'-5' exonuclease PolX [Candidatus Peregrinibacteria bacterium]|nr:DNA polymerase/3'-5' exonuclease PolX [Candidatus Peregrinibacteria bacterium]
MDNKKIAKVFDEMADILDIKGDTQFRINAYRRAALVISNLPKDLRIMVDKDPDEIAEIAGIGESLKDKIVELIHTGQCKSHLKLKKGFPSGLLEMLKIHGLGPKKVKLFYKKLKITTIKQLKKAAEQGKLSKLEGMGEKSEKAILKSIEEYSSFSHDRFLIHEAYMEAMNYKDYLNQNKQIKKIEYAGSLRRFKETIGDIDILATIKNNASSEVIMEHFVNYKEVLNVAAKGKTKSSVILESGIRVDLRVVDDECFGAAMHYFTGNKAHNIRIRDRAKQKGLKINEYGVFKDDKLIAGKTEQEVFASVKLPYIIPEIRRNEGEFEYASKNKKFPDFISLKNIKGDLHIHSNYSDGKYSVEEMVIACIEKGYKYMAISDHSSLVGITGGMKEKDVIKQGKEIDKLNKKYRSSIKIYKSSEVDILRDGSLDFSDKILSSLDVVIASVHTNFSLSENEQTARIIKALENKYVKILGHPFNRLINKRESIKFDFEKVVKACVHNNVALEINSNPKRLDLIDKYVKPAKEMGAKFVINTDAHSPGQLEFMVYGVGVGRRGWLDKRDVLNSYSVNKFDNYI